MAKILIVDDEPNIVVTLEFVLEQEGFAFEVVRRGDEVLAAVDAFDPDLVLLDGMLPGMDGFEVCRLLAARPSGPRVILLTARGLKAERVKGLDHGADRYVTKPFSTRELMDEVRACLADGRRNENLRDV